MARISYINPNEATGRSTELLDAVQARFGTAPNSLKAMAGYKHG
jgi:hypothetical protein